jgi:hypothetical protein
MTPLTASAIQPPDTRPVESWAEGLDRAVKAGLFGYFNGMGLMAQQPNSTMQGIARALMQQQQPTPLLPSMAVPALPAGAGGQ